ncbi:hypothetical protein [Devosia sp.]|uniref:hypothetical protein n=1 Tax=Devosia sp. TaxID=1871048 RepID=UPI003BAC308A
MPGNAHTRHHPQGSIGFNLGAIMLVVAMLGLGGAYLIDAAGRADRHPTAGDDTQTTLTRTLGGKDLEIPQAWFRYDEQRVEGFAKQIDLRLQLPLGARGKLEAIDITLLPRSRVRPSASLLDGVYLHQFLPEQIAGPPGLVGKPLRADDGYEDEIVWYDALAADPFVAKCSKPVVETEASQCLRTVYLGEGIAAVYAFPVAVLENWRQFDPEVKARLGKIGAL